MCPLQAKRSGRDAEMNDGEIQFIDDSEYSAWLDELDERKCDRYRELAERYAFEIDQGEICCIPPKINPHDD